MVAKGFLVFWVVSMEFMVAMRFFWVVAKDFLLARTGC